MVMNVLSAKTIILLALVFLVGVFGIGRLGSALSPVQATNNVSIHLIGDVQGWNFTTGSSNPSITVTQGDIVTISLTSGDGHPHQFILDMNGNGPSASDCNNPDPCSTVFSSSTSFSFTAGAPGTYTYYCTIHTPPTYNMKGSFTVRQATNPPPSQTGDFTISINPNSQNIAVGSSGQFTVAVTSLNGFTGTVTISPSISPGGPVVSASPSSVNIASAGGTGTSTITVSTTMGDGYYTSSTPTGAYTTTVTATSGSTSHTATGTANVGTSSNAPSNTPSNTTNNDSASLSPTMMAIIIGGIVVAVGVIGSVVYLRRR